MIFRVLFWPYYTFVLTNPINLISRTFFSHYGNKDQIYYDNQGLINFLNDIFKGKNRYRSCKAKAAKFGANRTSIAYQEHMQKYGEQFKPLYVKIIYAFFKKKYLLYIVYTTALEGIDVKKISRFDLDACERLDLDAFKRKLNRVCPDKTAEILQSL